MEDEIDDGGGGELDARGKKRLDASEGGGAVSPKTETAHTERGVSL